MLLVLRPLLLPHPVCRDRAAVFELRFSFGPQYAAVGIVKVKLPRRSCICGGAPRVPDELMSIGCISCAALGGRCAFIDASYFEPVQNIHGFGTAFNVGSETPNNASSAGLSECLIAVCAGAAVPSAPT